jgi:hypothetical protein
MSGAAGQRPNAHLTAVTITLPVTVSGSPCTFTDSVIW